MTKPIDIRTPLASLHTKNLLLWLEDARAFGPEGHVDATTDMRKANRPQDHTGHSPEQCISHNEGRDCYTVADLKAELATREHVPNKAERRAIRQQKARRRRP